MFKTSSWPGGRKTPMKSPSAERRHSIAALKGPEIRCPFPYSGHRSGFTVISGSECLSLPSHPSPKTHRESHHPQKASPDSPASPRTPISELLEPGTWLPSEPPGTLTSQNNCIRLQGQSHTCVG